MNSSIKFRRFFFLLIVFLTIFIKGSYGETLYKETLLGYISNGYDGKQLDQRNTLLRFQAENNLTVDGIWGGNTNDALYNGNKRIVDIVPTEIMDEEWFIVINKTKRILTVYKNGIVYKKYPVAVGKVSSPTPDYKFTIISKLKDPAWGGMGGRYKPVKGGAPNNPLGKRWLGLSRDKYTGYGIHGNSTPFSIGQYISAGCIRMINEDVEEIFEYIPIKTNVWVGTENTLEDWGIRQYLEYIEVDIAKDTELLDERSIEMKEMLSKLPKIELHCHLDGSVRPETMYELLLKEGEIIEVSDIEEFEKLVSVKEECESLKEYLEKFSYPLKVMQSKENIERITYELLEDLSKENVKYVEIRFAPFLHMDKGLSFDEVVESVLTGMSRAKDDFNILSNAILISMRHEPVEKSMEVIDLGEKYLGKGVVAVDLAGNEHDFPPEIHEKAFQLAYEKGYGITIHGGETGIVENISKSVELLHAKRIGHGIAAIKDPKVIELLKEKNIFLEMCPISNLQTKSVDSISDYPIRTYMEEGIGVTINTDNTTVSDTSLEKEYNLLMIEMNFTIEEILMIIDNGVEAAFISEEEKDSLRKIIQDELGELGL
ncbi:adenosine deaminase [Tissierella sp.]|uniref:adenosine deaminase n=1 Tax=Tissierella sp. TaxID=41274 RepID=UPI0028542667|nr:adenosine deaminase [Tissierella sp.]MDR7857906.1 adenosine deaminase [Tissierella sp.]